MTSATSDTAPSLQDVMRLVLLAGRVMLESGANASRIEETLMRLALSCGVDSIDVFCTLTGLFFTVVKNDEVLTRVLSVRQHGTDLGRIAAVYDLSRAVESRAVDCHTAIDQMKAMVLHESMIGYPPWLKLACSGVSSGAFAVMIARREVERGRPGQVIDLPLLDPIVSILGPQAESWRVSGQLPRRTGSRSQTTSPRNVFRTRDGR